MGSDDAWVSPGAVLARLDGGEEIPEGLLVRHLRAPSCPRELVQRLAACRWVRSLQRVPPLLIRHPACPRPFAWEMLPRLGWHDLLLVVRNPRTSPPIRRQAERKLRDRVPRLTLGERTALARQAPRGLIDAFLTDEAPACIRALLDNPAFGEADAVRMLAVSCNVTCVAALLRHPRWGAARAVTLAALRSTTVPLGVALGIVATLSHHRLRELSRAGDLPEALRDAIIALLERRGSATDGRR